MNDGHGTERRYNHGPDQHDHPGHGCRCDPCTTAANHARKWRKYRAVLEGPVLVDATGTRRRLQALIAAGWSGPVLARRLGMQERHVRLILHDTSRRVLGSTAAKVMKLYDELWDQAPPERTQGEKHSVRLSRNHAARQGWVSGGYWDDDPWDYERERPSRHWIDDPKARPARGWKRDEETVS